MAEIDVNARVGDIIQLTDPDTGKVYRFDATVLMQELNNPVNSDFDKDRLWQQMLVDLKDVPQPQFTDRGKTLIYRPDANGKFNFVWSSIASQDTIELLDERVDEIATELAGLETSVEQIYPKANNYLVNTVAELRTLAVSAYDVITKFTAQVVGYRTLGDGGGGLFYFDPTSTEPDDGGLVLMPSWNPASGRWKRSYNGSYVELPWFGAYGNGTNDDTLFLANARASGKRIDGLGRVYAVSAVLDDDVNIVNAVFKVGFIYYPTKDYLQTDVSKITNAGIYTAWTQDKCYTAYGQIVIWALEKESHADGTGRIVRLVCGDGGSSYTETEYLEAKAGGKTLWSAGFDGTYEYLYVRVPAGGTDTAPYTYELWKRALGTDATQNFNGAWTKTAITFPIPDGFTGQPIMVHSFTVGHEGSIVVGASYGEGAAIMRSLNGETGWVATVLHQASTSEEPTVKYDAASGVYCGFLRNSGGNPRYWYSDDLLATTQYFTAANGFFNASGMNSSTVPLAIKDGIIHAVTAYRNGVIEGLGTDDRASFFYITGPITKGNFWIQPTTKVYNLGKLQRREHGGASAIGQGSVVISDDKIILLYGQEERTGAIAGFGKGNRVANINQLVLSTKSRTGAYDIRNDLVGNRAYGGPFRKIQNLDAFMVPTFDTTGRPAVVVSGRVNQFLNPTTLAIASDVLILTGTRAGLYIVNTEASAATDNLASIVDTDAFDGDVITLMAFSASRKITVKNGIGNIYCGSDRLLNTGFDKISFIYYNGGWHMLNFQANA